MQLVFPALQQPSTWIWCPRLLLWEKPEGKKKEGVRFKAQGLPLHCYYPRPILEKDSKIDSKPIFLQD